MLDVGYWVLEIINPDLLFVKTQWILLQGDCQIPAFGLDVREPQTSARLRRAQSSRSVEPSNDLALVLSDVLSLSKGNTEGIQAEQN